MSDIASINASLGFTDDSKSGSALSKMSQDFDNFLTLLTTQLQNQDPLDPMDNTEMTNQIVNFANIEQQIAQNKNLENIASMMTTQANAATIGFIGKEVQVAGKVTDYSGSDVTFGYTLPYAATTANVFITNADGEVVRTIDGPGAAARNEIVWDGLDDDGAEVPQGTYSFAVGAEDSDGEAILAKSTDITGNVTGTTFGEDGSELLIGSTGYSPTLVQAVRSISGI